MRPRNSRRRPAFKNAVHRSSSAPCPTPKKLAFDTSFQAEEVLRYTHHEGRAYTPHAIYQCVCGKWHWTSKEQY